MGRTLSQAHRKKTSVRAPRLSPFSDSPGRAPAPQPTLASHGRTLADPVNLASAPGRRRAHAPRGGGAPLHRECGPDPRRRARLDLHPSARRRPRHAPPAARAPRRAAARAHARRAEPCRDAAGHVPGRTALELALLGPDGGVGTGGALFFVGRGSCVCLVGEPSLTFPPPFPFAHSFFFTHAHNMPTTRTPTPPHTHTHTPPPTPRPSSSPSGSRARAPSKPWTARWGCPFGRSTSPSPRWWAGACWAR